MKREQWKEDVDIQITFPDDKDRQETVIEITNSDHSHTFGYLLPEYAARAVTAVNSHEMLIEALREMCNQFYPHKCKTHGPMICDKCEALRVAGAALIVAGGRQELNNGSQNIRV